MDGSKIQLKMLVLISALLLFATPATASTECGIVDATKHFCVRPTGDTGVELWVVEASLGSRLHIKVDCMTKAVRIVKASEEWSVPMIQQGAKLACKHVYSDAVKGSVI